MMIGFSQYQYLPEPKVPVDYALSRWVHKRADKDPVLRDPAPELLFGQPGNG